MSATLPKHWPFRSARGASARSCARSDDDWFSLVESRLAPVAGRSGRARLGERALPRASARGSRRPTSSRLRGRRPSFDAEALPYADGEFANLVLIDVFHHIASPPRFLDGGRAVARSGRSRRDPRPLLLARVRPRSTAASITSEPTSTPTHSEDASGSQTPLRRIRRAPPLRSSEQATSWSAVAEPRDRRATPAGAARVPALGGLHAAVGSCR